MSFVNVCLQDAVSNKTLVYVPGVLVVVNFYFQLNFSFLCFFVYGNVYKNKGKLKFNWTKKNNHNIIENAPVNFYCLL